MTFKESLEELLTILENAVQYDMALRQTRSKQGKSPKSIHAEVINDILTAHQSELDRAVKQALENPNELLRSAFAIAKRDGLDTNWEPFRRRLIEELRRERKIMYPKAQLEQGDKQ